MQACRVLNRSIVRLESSNSFDFDAELSDYEIKKIFIETWRLYKFLREHSV